MICATISEVGATNVSWFRIVTTTDSTQQNRLKIARAMSHPHEAGGDVVTNEPSNATMSASSLHTVQKKKLNTAVSSGCTATGTTDTRKVTIAGWSAQSM